MLDDFDHPRAHHPTTTAPESMALGMSHSKSAEPCASVPAPILAWWRENPALTSEEVDALARLFPALHAVVNAFAETTLIVLEDLGPLPTDLLAVALADAREDLVRSSCAAWAVPGARALSLAYLGAEPDGRLQLALGVNGHEGPGTQGEELGGPLPPAGERRWRGPIERILNAVQLNSGEIPVGTRAKARLGLAWHCGEESRVLALCGGEPARRREAERAVRDAVSIEQAVQRFMERVGAREDGAKDLPAPAPARGPSPLHRWTWQRLLIFGVLLFLSAWAYLGDK